MSATSTDVKATRSLARLLSTTDGMTRAELIAWGFKAREITVAMRSGAVYQDGQFVRITH
jgi:hypothetical protein